MNYYSEKMLFVGAAWDQQTGKFPRENRDSLLSLSHIFDLFGYVYTDSDDRSLRKQSGPRIRKTY